MTPTPLLPPRSSPMELKTLLRSVGQPTTPSPLVWTARACSMASNKKNLATATVSCLRLPVRFQVGKGVGV